MKQEIRVGIIGPCPPPYGGVTRLIMNNLHYWKGKGIEVFFIPHRIPETPQPPEGATFIDYRIVENSRPLSITDMAGYYLHFPFMKIRNYINFYNYNSALAEIIRQYQIDLICAHHAGVTGLSAVLQSKLSRIPSVVVSYGETWLASSIDRRFKRMAKFILRQASWILSTSEHCRRGALKLGADPERASVIYAGIDLNRFKPGLDGSIYRNKIGIPKTTLVISCLGLALRNKIDTFLETIRYLRNEKNIIFLIGGVGDDFEYLQTKIRELNMGNVKLLGFIAEAELPHFYAATDILVASPKTVIECMGQSIKEAMACGLPTVVADIGGGPEAVAHQETGLLFRAGDARALADALRQLINAPAIRKTMGEKAVIAARTKFDAAKCSVDLLQLFRAVLNENVSN